MTKGNPIATKAKRYCINTSALNPKRGSGGNVSKKTGANWMKAIPPTK